MTTLFIDYEGGNDNYGGTSFALLASGTDGRITSTTFSSATASFPNDGSLIGHYLTIWNASIYACYQITAWVSGTELTIAALSGGTALANQAVDRQYYIGGRWKTITSGATSVRTVPGDTIRLMASPEPTLVGNATWTGTPVLTGLTITSSTNATPIVVTKASHGLSDNDYILLTGHTTNTNANGIWQITYINADTFSLDGSVGNGVGGETGGFRKINNAVVELAAAKTQLIAGCSSQEGAWTASANVTATVNTTDYKNHYGSASIAIAAGFTTGKAAYFPTGTLDLSAYEQVSFWIKQKAGTIPADGAITLTLCSDAAGATPVDTISVPSCKILNYWMPVTVDTGSALGASIQSVALNVATDNGAQTFLIGEIIACLPSSDADSLSLTSLIGKNTTGETFVGIQSINGTRVVLDCDVNHIPTPYNTNLSGYSSLSGTTETVATYKREPIRMTPASTEWATTPNSMPEAGTYAAPIHYTCGWDRTAMATQNGETWWDGGNGCGSGIYTGASFIHVESFRAVRYQYGYWQNGPIYGCDVDDFHGNNCYIGFYANGTFGSQIGSIVAKACTQCVNFSSYGGHVDSIIARDIGGTNAYLTLLSGDLCVIEYVEVANDFCANSNTGMLYVRDGVIINSARVQYRSSSYGIFMMGHGSDVFIRNMQVDDAQLTAFGWLTYQHNKIHVHNYDNTADDHRIYSVFGNIVTDATMAHGTAAYGWKFSPTTTITDTDWPLMMKVGRIALAANVTKTIGYWMRRDNTGLTMKLVCKGGQLAGIAADVTTSMTAAIDTWELVQISLTPTETGVVELEAHAYGGATYNGWVSEMEVA